MWGGIVSNAHSTAIPMDLVIVRRDADGEFVVTDDTGNLIFKVKQPSFCSRRKLVLLDTSGSSVVILREKRMSIHGRWQVFKGGSKKACDMLYSVKRSSMMGSKTKLNVFMSHNKGEKSRDVRIRGSCIDRSCVVYAGDSDSILAHMKKYTVQSIFEGKDKFTVTVNPNVDYAFVASLILILDRVSSSGSCCCCTSHSH